MRILILLCTIGIVNLFCYRTENQLTEAQTQEIIAEFGSIV